MATRAEIRSQVRVKLEDVSSGAPLFSDSDLNTFAGLALQEYGRWAPLQAAAVAVVGAGATTVAHPSGAAAGTVVTVLDARGTVVPLNEHAGHGPAQSVYLAQGWRSWASVIQLVRPVGTDEAGNWTIRYLGFRSLPANDPDQMPIEPGHEPVVVQLIVAEALHRRAVEDYKRGAKPSSVGAAGEARNLARDMFRSVTRRARGGALDVA